MAKLYLDYESDNDDQTTAEHLGAITEQREQLRSSYGNDIFLYITEADDVQGAAEAVQANDEDKANEVQGKKEDAGNHEKNNPAEEVQGDDEDAYNVEEKDEAEEVQENEDADGNPEKYDQAEEFQGDDEDAHDNGDELLGLLADTATDVLAACNVADKDFKAV